VPPSTPCDTLRLVRLAQEHGAARRTRARTHAKLNSTMLQVALKSLAEECSQLRLNCYHRHIIFFLLPVLVYALLRRPLPQLPPLRPHSSASRLSCAHANSGTQISRTKCLRHTNSQGDLRMYADTNKHTHGDRLTGACKRTRTRARARARARAHLGDSLGDSLGEASPATPAPFPLRPPPPPDLPFPLRPPPPPDLCSSPLAPSPMAADMLSDGICAKHTRETRHVISDEQEEDSESP
jgi:hypothetical protein